MVPSCSFPWSGHQALLTTEGIPAPGPWGAAGQQQGRVSLPACPTVRISHPEGRNAADTGLTLVPTGSASHTGRQTLACECFKNKQTELDLFLNFREAQEQVSLTKRSPFFQWHFKDDSTSLTSALITMTNVEGMPGGCSRSDSPIDPRESAVRDLLCLLI